MLIDMYSVVENVTASSLIFWGLALMINSHIIESFIKTFTNVEDNETLSYLTGSMFFILGLIVLFVHNDWYLSFSLIVTLTGWIVAIKAALWVLFPFFFARQLKKISPLILNFWFRMVSGGFLIILGLLIFLKYFQEAASPI